MGALDIGTVRVHSEDGADEVIAVHGGFVEVSHDRVTVLSDVAEVASQIDVGQAPAPLGASGESAPRPCRRRRGRPAPRHPSALRRPSAAPAAAH